MNTLNFLFNQTSLKIYGNVEDPFFVVNEVCKIINIRRDSDMVRSIVKDVYFQSGLKTITEIPHYQGKKMTVVNEFGLYEILFRSNSELAK